jgi:nicotinamidase/pyrazinamidase
MMEGKALIVVDVQRDFLPGGALAVEHGDEVVDLVAAYARAFPHVFVTQDWHPAETAHFVKWPVHCVQGTAGADLAEPVDRLVVQGAPVIRKGASARDDGYSGFEGRRSVHGDPTGPTLEESLREAGVLEVHVAGLATDFCVRATALDAARLGFRVVAPAELSRPVAWSSGVAALEEMRAAGVET